MNIIWLVVIILVILVVLFLGLDFTRFVKANSKEEKKNGVQCNSGGVLFVQGRKTYYQMPSGTRRKIADFPMDLTPGSKDMNEFTRIMEQAAKERINEDRNLRKKAKENMIGVAIDVSRGTEEGEDGKK